MKLKESQIAKIDPLLQQILEQADGNEIIRTVMILGAENPEVEKAAIPKLDPSQFPSRQAYREALIAYRQKQLADTLGGTLKALENLSLKTRGGKISSTVLVEGTADQIYSSLELSGVRQVNFDELIGLNEIVPIELVENVANIFIETVYQNKDQKDLFGVVIPWLNKTIDEKTKRLISQASEQYILNYNKYYGKLKVLGMKQPVDLESVYTAVQLIDKQDVRQFESIESLEQAYRETKTRSFQIQDCPKQDGIEIANQAQYLMVLGAPGAGKSTFLRKLGLEAFKGKQGKLKHPCIPVLIELKKFTNTAINIEKSICNEFKESGFPSPETFTAKALERGNLLILLDGLDEVPTKNMNKVITQICEFVKKYEKNRFIVSCRTAAYRSSFYRFMDVVVADFDDTQIQQFIKNWFQSEADKKAKTAEKCWELLQKPENAAAKELAHTPLLLTFLCLVYDRSQKFPENRSILYNKALRILLEEWAAEKRIQQDENYQWLSIEVEELLLAEIAYTGFETDRLFFSSQQLIKKINQFLASNANLTHNLDAEAILNTIVVQQGILVERAEDIFSFSHLTLQEYLVAQYIDDHRLIEELVVNHLTDERWKEVFLLVAGLMRGGADELLLQMEKEAQKYINSPKLKRILKWAEEATNGSPGDLKPVAKRAIANAYAYAYAYAIAYAYVIHIDIDHAIAIDNAYAYAIAYPIDIPIDNAYMGIIVSARAIANANAIVIDNFIYLAEELQKINIFNNFNASVLIAKLQALKMKNPDNKQPQNVRQSFVKCVLGTWLNAFNLNLDMINLSKEELKEFDNYFYANYLILQCKEAAVRVSPQTWQAIEDRMLTVPNN